jgi:hypothetical protein
MGAEEGMSVVGKLICHTTLLICSGDRFKLLPPVKNLPSYSTNSLDAEVDVQILEDAENNYKVRADMRREGWHYDYSLTRSKSKM